MVVFFIFVRMPSSHIFLKNVSKSYTGDTKSGVENIDLSINKGEFVAIVGESGSGKSTLLKLIYGLIPADSGKLYFNGEPIPGPADKLIPGHDSMKMLSQDFDLNVYAKVRENINSMLSNEDIRAKRQKTAEMMEFLGIDGLAERRIVELSGGEQQRVALARAIITEPEVLLLDEPFSQLDAILKNQFRADLKRLCKSLGITIILVSHDPVDGLTLANRLIILRDGKLIESGEPAEVYNSPKHIYTARLLGNAFVLPASEAREMGIRADKERVMIYPEWIQLKSSWSSKKYVIKEIFFKGFYEELLLERNKIRISAINNRPGIYKVGQPVQVLVTRLLEFD